MTFDAVERIADAVLYEGYLLYPYRASAVKNRMRWQFGVIAPRSTREDGEPSFSQTECLVKAAADSRVYVRVRYLTTDSGQGVRQAIDIIPFDPSRQDTRRIGFGVDGVKARLTIDVDPGKPDPTGQAGRRELVKLRFTLENLEPWQREFESDRDAMLRHSLVSAHLLLCVDEGEFVSLIEPAAEDEEAARACTNRHTWPVLVGDRTCRNMMLSSPILLYDYPAVAAESPGDLCDATEIDEILSLRILTLTDEEKRQARETDPFAARIIDRTEALSVGSWGALHGTMRSADFFNPPGAEPPESASVAVAGGVVSSGSHVCLRPKRRADAMDMFLDGQAATVTGVYRDVDDRVYVAVTVDADPAAELHGSFGRYFYFNPDEIEMRNA